VPVAAGYGHDDSSILKEWLIGYAAC
jgi:hypothetical protein